MITREELHRLIDALPESEWQAARRFLEYLRDRGVDPLLRALADAPEDDEPVTPEEEAAIREAYQAIARGEVVPLEDVARRLLDDTPECPGG